MGLKRIFLRDFVIVHALELDLSGGFSALTGETGAGKSILIDALQLALGGRGEAGVVREGAARCEISALFDCPPLLASWLEQAGLLADEEILLRRVIDAQGKSRAWINGSPATLAQLKEVADHLVDIHGQHAWQSLTRPDAVRGLLDAYAGLATHALTQRWHTWRSAQAALAQARAAQGTLLQEQERLRWQIGEIEKLAPQEHEWEEINTQHTRLSHAQTLRAAVQTALEALQEADHNATGLLGRATAALEHHTTIEPAFAAIVDVLASALAQAQDVVHSLHGYARHADVEPQDLQALDDRLALWVGLARRYKHPPEVLPALLAAWQAELQALEATADLEALEKHEAQAHAAYVQEAQRISSQRAQTAPVLSQAITQAMQGLGMQGGQFQVALQPLQEAAQHGLEQVEFLVAGHAGTTPRPVGKVASGGELSRIALAIAVTTSQLGQAGTLIFDEIDAGVGGAVAHTVGRLMKKLGKDRQVLAVTHLPQVAACADHHWVVSKTTAQGAPVSTVQALTQEQRVPEIARMLGGEHLSATSLAHAKEMLAS